jgi:hypothetical protein
MCKNFRLSPLHLREFALENRGDAAMQLLPSGSQHRTVGRVLHQRVLEGVLRIRRGAAPKNQFGALKLDQGIIELLWDLCYSTNQLV